MVEALALAGDAQRALDVGYRLLRTLEAVDADAARAAAARLALARAALAAAEPAGEPAAACQALEVLGRLARTRDLAEAGRWFDRAQAVAERYGLRLWRARAPHEVATVEFTETLRVVGLHRARGAAVEAGAAGLVASIDLHLPAIHGVRFEPAPALPGLHGQAAFGWVCGAGPRVDR